MKATPWYDSPTIGNIKPYLKDGNSLVPNPAYVEAQQKQRMKNALDIVKALADCHVGLDLQFRRSRNDWPANWRASLRTGAKFPERNLACYGNTPEEALLRLAYEISQINI